MNLYPGTGVTLSDTQVLVAALREMEKTLVTSIFPFSNSVFESLIFKVVKSRD